MYRENTQAIMLLVSCWGGEEEEEGEGGGGRRSGEEGGGGGGSRRRTGIQEQDGEDEEEEESHAEPFTHKHVVVWGLGTRIRSSGCGLLPERYYSQVHVIYFS